MPSPLRDPKYRRFLAVMLAGDLALQVQAVAVAWHIFSISHRALDLGLVGLCLFAPTLLLALYVGVFADRHDRRIIVVCTMLCEMALSLAFITLILRGVDVSWPYFVLLVVTGIARAFSTPASRSLLPSIVSQDQYLSAQALYASIRELNVIVGPALGGALVAIGTPVAFGVAAALFLIAAGAMWTLRVPPVAGVAPAATLSSALDGIRYIVQRPIIAGAISLDLFAVLFGSITAILPVVAVQVLHVGPLGFGLLRSSPSVGAVLVAVYLARRPPERRVGPLMIACVFGFGVATVLFGLSHTLWLSMMLLAFTGAFDVVSVVIRNGLVQMRTPEGMRGRVNAVENVFIGASNDLGAFKAGSLATLIGTIPSIVVGGAATIAVIGLWTLLFPALRNADKITDGTTAAAT